MAMQDKVKCIETEDAVFFDSVDHMSAEHGSATVDEVLGYEYWRNEPRSVKERRNIFLREMCFIEPEAEAAPAAEADGDQLEMGLKKVIERSGAVSSLCSPSAIDCEEDNVVFCGREWDKDANTDVNEPQDDHRPCLDVSEDDEPSTSKSYKSINKKIRYWWKYMMKKQRASISGYKFKVDTDKPQKFETSRTEVQVTKKKFKELSALFATQEIQAHRGIIRTMKFSPDGQYLATGGKDGVVRVWSNKFVNSCLEKFPDESGSPRRDENTGFQREKKAEIPVVIPDKMFKFEELPVQEFHGHAADVLDLAWSNSNLLLSSSIDKTVRLWQLGSDTCLNTFHHTDYVTCVQFNPVDNRYFISGSIDGKVRIWGVSKQRVLDWADIRDAVTAVCYQPDGQAFVVGSLSGSCLFYETKGKLFELSAQILLENSKRSSPNRITGIQFSSQDSQSIIISSEDSKIRILDKTDFICKYRGLPKSGSQMSASFTSDGRHIISIGQDSRVYVWNHDNPIQSSLNHTKSIRSCEHFFSEGVSVAATWGGTETLQKFSSSLSTNHEASCIARSPPNASLRNMFSSKSSAIWPEDMLPVFTQPEDHCQGRNYIAHFPTWGLVIVTANSDGTIRTFQNYGLPTRV